MPKNIFIQETYCAVKESPSGDLDAYRMGETDVYETFTDNVGDLFSALQREHGRCVGKVYAEPNDTPIGWIFQKCKRHTDSTATYLAETWVTLHTAPPTKTIEYHHKTLE